MQWICIIVKHHFSSRLPDASFNHDRNVFLFVMHASMVHYKRSSLRNYNRVFYIIANIQHWRNFWVRGVCTPQCDANTVGETWQMTFPRPSEIVANATEISRKKRNYGPTTFYHKRPTGACGHGHREIIPGNAKPQSVRSCHYGSLQNVCESRADL